MTGSILGQGRGLTLLRSVQCGQGESKVPWINETFVAYRLSKSQHRRLGARLWILSNERIGTVTLLDLSNIKERGLFGRVNGVE